MALKITPGPLPADGTRFKIEDMLTTFVQGTEITNFGPEEFGAAADVSFVISATDPPATNIRSRGTLWFARGDGHLYQWTVHPSPTEAPTAVTEASWVAISDRREILVRVLRPVAAGETMRWSAENSNVSNFPGFGVELSEDGRYTPIYSASTATDVDWSTFRTGWWIDPVLVSVTDSDGPFVIATEFGFCSALVTGPGAQSEAPQFGYVLGDQVAERFDVLYGSDSSAWTNTTARAAFLSESAPSGSQRALSVFLAPTLTNLVKGEPNTNPFG